MMSAPLGCIISLAARRTCPVVRLDSSSTVRPLLAQAVGSDPNENGHEYNDEHAEHVLVVDQRLVRLLGAHAKCRRRHIERIVEISGLESSGLSVKAVQMRLLFHFLRSIFLEVTVAT